MRTLDQQTGADGVGYERSRVSPELTPVESEAGWRAKLDLEVERRDERSVLSRSAHVGPLRVQRAFYPEGQGSCHVYVLHPPGGVVSGDRLELNVAAGAGSSILVTTPGATKLYRARASVDEGTAARSNEHSDARDARLSQRFHGAAGAAIEWLPQDTIAFDGCRARIDTEIVLAADAVYAGWEILCLGRPAAKECFTRGCLRSACSIRRAGALRYVERSRYEGGDLILSATWGLRGEPVVGTFLIAAPGACSEWVELVRSELGDVSPHFAVTLVSGTFVARYVGPSTLQVRALFERTFSLLRPHYLGRPAVFPRIWRT